MSPAEMGLSEGSKVADWERIAGEYADAFPLIALDEVREKMESMFGFPMVESTQRMLAWAAGLQLQRALLDPRNLTNETARALVERTGDLNERLAVLESKATP
jgi:hypothetical protein